MMDINGVSAQNLSVHAAYAASSTPPGSRNAEAPENAARAAPEGSGPGEASVQRVIEETEAAPVQQQRSGVRMRVDEASDRTVVQIVGDNDEVIKQIPPEEMLKVITRLRQMEGVLFDREA